MIGILQQQRVLEALEIVRSDTATQNAGMQDLAARFHVENAYVPAGVQYARDARGLRLQYGRPGIVDFAPDVLAGGNVVELDYQVVAIRNRRQNALAGNLDALLIDYTEIRGLTSTPSLARNTRPAPAVPPEPSVTKI